MIMGNDVFRSLNIELSEQSRETLLSLSERGAFQFGSARPSDIVTTASYLSWFPGNRDPRKLTAIVSSRIGRALDRKDAFFRILRIACSQLDPRRQALLSAAGTASHPYVVRSAELFGVDVLSVAVAKTTKSIEKWLLELSATDDETLGATKCFVSPPLPNASLSHPFRDEVVMHLADQVLAVHVREKGSVEALIQQRLAERAPSRVFLAVGDDELVSQSVAHPLMEQGAIGWFVTANETDSSAVAPLMHAESKQRKQPPIISIEEFRDQDRYLSHCTRNANGPWPDQSETDYIDDLVLGDVWRDRSALAALMRIVGQRRILATSDAIRKSTPVVSLTAVPLRELPELRRFRSHRGRWDFEPYGLAIDRECLSSLGAREVIYGSESMWDRLGTKDQPFFQKLGAAANSIDWRVEKEFRVLEDVDLECFSPSQAVVFVPTRKEAEHVARISRWPIVVTTQS